jgi:outer membrane protein assembly factor BamB
MGQNRDGVWRETGIIKKFPVEGLKAVWRKPVGIGYSGPSVSDGKVYMMDFTPAPSEESDEVAKPDVKKADAKQDDQATDKRSEKKETQDEKKKDDKAKQRPPSGIRGIKGVERVFCLDEKTGKQIWDHKYETTYAISYPNGPRCTPIVDGDKVYALGAMGQLICFDKNKGDIVWQKNLPKEYGTKPPIWGYASHPLIDGDTIYLPVGGTGSALVAFHKNDGKEIWKSLTTFDISYVPLVLFGEGDSRQLFFWNGDGINSVNPKNGEKYWDINLRDHNPQAQAISIAMPRVVDNELFISDFFMGSMLVRLDKQPTRHKEIWRTTKEQKRAGTHLNSLMMTPFIYDGHAYGVGSNGRGDGLLMCVRVEDGEKVWSETTSLGKGRLTFASLFIIKNEDRFFLCNDQGEIIIANLTPKGYEEISRTKILEPTHKARGRTVVWSHPAFANGHIFARNDKEIVCYDLRESSYSNEE